MKTYLLLIPALFLSTIVESQIKKNTLIGTLIFEASVPSFEEVKATNKSVKSSLNCKTGELLCEIELKKFQFRLPLMQEHFNTNYLESNRYPKATFKGKIKDFNWFAIGVVPKEFIVIGKLEIHGVTKNIAVLLKINKVTTAIEIHSTFKIKSSDYKIAIPRIIKSKISEIVTINLELLLK